jgi:hypothetical protein
MLFERLGKYCQKKFSGEKRDDYYKVTGFFGMCVLINNTASYSFSM